jgi:hypothetical protein
LGVVVLGVVERLEAIQCALGGLDNPPMAGRFVGDG